MFRCVIFVFPNIEISFRGPNKGANAPLPNAIT
jgi:hypothetical protein